VIVCGETEPINVLSVYATDERVTGPGKVLRNTLRGFDQIGQPYYLNAPLESTRRVWVHCHGRALVDLRKHESIVLIGPNQAAFPCDLTKNPPRYKSALLQPSQWVVDLWRDEGYTELPVHRWPAGVDIEAWPRREAATPRPEGELLVYHKYRPTAELQHLCSRLTEYKIPHRVLTCGSYTEPQYREALRKCPFVIWLGRAETQGFALLEALSSDVPILVIEPKGILHAQPLPMVIPRSLKNHKATSAPYFDERCGVRIQDLGQLDEALQEMRRRLNEFSPSSYVEDNLTLRSQATALVRIFDSLEDRGSKAKPITIVNRSYRPSIEATLECAVHRANVKVQAAVAHLALQRAKHSSGPRRGKPARNPQQRAEEQGCSSEPNYTRQSPHETNATR